MKCVLAILLVAVASAQPQPTILTGPTDWRFEKMPVPPQFAPRIPFKGFEEVRFAPGVFDNASPNYFTYVFVLSLEGTPNLDPAALKDFLEKYYRGLSVAVGRPKGQSPDVSQMTATVSPAGPGHFTARVVFFDSFTDGRKITLNIEGRVVHRPSKTGLVLLVSPQSKENNAWTKLHEIDAHIVLPD
ncbi:MAG TPA: hypothetical protein VGL72_28695 [Bryobacteraceae bacterium]|jgi:hypothetical protein